MATPIVVTVVERMGNEAIIYGTLQDGQEIVARVDPRCQFQVGEAVELGLDVDRVYLFDPTTGQAI